MIKKLHIYIAKNIIIANIIIIVAVAGIYWLLLMMTEAKNIGVGNYNINTMLLCTLLLLPKNLYNIFPMISLVATLLGLGYLVKNNEIIIMQVSGMSKKHLSKVIIIIAMIIVIIISILAEIWTPKLAKKANNLKLNAINGNYLSNTANGIWLQQKNSIIYLGKILNNKLYNITKYNYQQQNLISIISASSGILKNNHHLILKNVKVIHFDYKTPKITIDYLITKTLNSNLKILQTLFNNLNDASLLQLYKYIHYNNNNLDNRQNRKYAIIFWQRIFMPISTMLMIFLALPFTFLANVRNVSSVIRILFGTLISLIFYLLIHIISLISVFSSIPPIITAILPNIIIALPLLFILFKIFA